MRDYHDRRYKYVFSHPLFVQHLLESFVHEDFIKELDYSSLKRIDKSFITSKFEKYESDIVYEVYIKEKPIYIYILMEFQSTVDKKMPFRFLRYILELYEAFGFNKNTNSYPAIFPLLLYNGEPKWTAEINFQNMISKTISDRYIPHFSYYPIIINEIDKNSLLQIHNAVSGIFYMEKSNIKKYNEAIRGLAEIISGIPLVEKDVLQNWLYSFFKSNKIECSKTSIEEIISQKDGKPMFEASIKKYWEEKIEEGIFNEKTEIALNLLKEGSEMEFVSKITGLSIEEIKNLVTKISTQE